MARPIWSAVFRSQARKVAERKTYGLRGRASMNWDDPGDPKLEYYPRTDEELFPISLGELEALGRSQQALRLGAQLRGVAKQLIAGGEVMGNQGFRHA